MELEKCFLEVDKKRSYKFCMKYYLPVFNYTKWATVRNLVIILGKVNVI
jgi:hypothetical protein